MKHPMSKILPGLYIGDISDAQEVFDQNSYGITHIISLRSVPKRMLQLYHYLHIPIADTKNQNIARYFSLCNDTIHQARLANNDNNVLVHCYAGISRSATVIIAYLMTIADIDWEDAWHAIQTVRPIVRPNSYFQQLLEQYQRFGLKTEKRRFKKKFPSKKLESWDRFRIEALLNNDERMCASCAYRSQKGSVHSVEEQDDDDLELSWCGSYRR